MTAQLPSLAWPLSRLHDAVDGLARYAGHPPATAAGAPMPFVVENADADARGRALQRLGAAHGLEVEPVTIRYRDVEELPTPLILQMPASATVEAGASFVIVLHRRGRWITVLGPDRGLYQVRAALLAAALRGPLDAQRAAEVDRLLDATSVAPHRRARVHRALLADQLAGAHAADAWHIAAEPGGDFGRALRRAGVGRGVGALLSLHAAQFALWILSWWLIGRAAFQGRTDWGWLTAWTLLVATIVPLQLWTAWTQGAVALGSGRLLKERLLTGALRLKPGQIRQQGVGQLLGRVLESAAVESLAISGGLQAALAGVEIVMAGGVLWFGATGGAHAALLAAWTAAGGMVAWAYYKCLRGWAAWRRTMTHDLVERISGHRTRLAQQEPARWHEDEDRALEEYIARSSALDAWSPALLVGLSRGWTTVAVAVLAAAFVTGTSPERLAISVGGILLASLALHRFAEGLSQLAGAAIAWNEARPLFDAAAHRPLDGGMGGASSGRPSPGDTVLDVRDVSFRYPGRAQAVLHGCTLRVGDGARVLIQGKSGGGKSTFGSIVAGLQEADSGLVLIDGLDRRTLGADEWRRRIVSVPQFHENHVLSETFAFNLLMGRRWPPTEGDLRDAEEIVEELGLGPVLQRMPAGLLQLVGESGWQLSHGERSRLFIARALLQGGDVTILDESFAALDPENLRHALDCVLRRARTLLVIAHP